MKAGIVLSTKNSKNQGSREVVVLLGRCTNEQMATAKHFPGCREAKDDTCCSSSNGVSTFEKKN